MNNQTKFGQQLLDAICEAVAKTTVKRGYAGMGMIGFFIGACGASY